MTLFRYSIRGLFTLTILLCIIFAIHAALTRPPLADLQSDAINDLILEQYPPGTDFTGYEPSLDFLIGKDTSELPRLLRHAKLLDRKKISNLLDRSDVNYKLPYEPTENIGISRTEEMLSENGVPWHMILAWKKHPNLEDGMSFYHFHVNRGKLTGYFPYQDNLVLCVKDDVIVDIITTSIYLY